MSWTVFSQESQKCNQGKHLLCEKTYENGGCQCRCHWDSAEKCVGFDGHKGWLQSGYVFCPNCGERLEEV